MKHSSLYFVLVFIVLVLLFLWNSIVNGVSLISVKQILGIFLLFSIYVFWEGFTFIDPQSPNYNPNNWYVRKGWGTTPGTESGIISYNEVKRIGNTVFMINNPAYRSQSYP